MKALGAGTALSLGAGTAVAGHDQPHTPHIDSHYGYSAPTDERLPGKLRPDHEVGLHIHENALTDEDPTTIPFHFAPMGLKVDEGDIVRFDFDTPEHTITAYHEGQGRQQRVPDDNPPFSSPVISTGGFWLYEFDSAGTYDLFCAPHEFFGMVMRIVVGDPGDPAYDGTFGPAGPPPQPRPPVSRPELTALGITSFPFPTAAEVLGTNVLSVSNIVSSGSVSVSAVEADL
ncbi:cupredoxin domain-containing protein [Halovenus marina]|uniref:cupredoxin domain-containing protein n=1 Tax=Halovenus marina TaxID=3396621 RepID=UPI003F57621C